METTRMNFENMEKKEKHIKYTQRSTLHIGIIIKQTISPTELGTAPTYNSDIC